MNFDIIWTNLTYLLTSSNKFNSISALTFLNSSLHDWTVPPPSVCFCFVFEFGQELLIYPCRLPGIFAIPELWGSDPWILSRFLGPFLLLKVLTLALILKTWNVKLQRNRTRRKARYNERQVVQPNLRQSALQQWVRKLRQESWHDSHSSTDDLHFLIALFTSALESFRQRSGTPQCLELEGGGGYTSTTKLWGEIRQNKYLEQKN